MIYLDNASTTYIYPEVIEQVYKILKENWGNPSNIYKFGFQSKEIIEGAREIIAKALNVKSHNIFFTSGSSEGNAWALRQGERCVCSPYEHHNITNNENSIIADEDFLDKILNLDWTNASRLKKTYSSWVYSHMLVSNETGEVFDVEPMFDKAKQIGFFTHCDMTQALGNMLIDFNDYPHVDMATFSGHKIHAPKGIGFVYISDSALNNEKRPIKPLLFGGIQEKNLRAGTENIAYIAGLSTAVEKTVQHINEKRNNSLELSNICLNYLNNNNLPAYLLTTSTTNYIPSTFTFCLKGIEGEVIQSMLSEQNIFIGTGSACGDGTMEVGETLKYMNVPEDYIHGEIRLSFDITTTKEDVITALDEILKVYNQSLCCR